MMSTCATYKSLFKYCKENLATMPPLGETVDLRDLSLQSLFLEEDVVSTPLIPGDLPEKPAYELVAADVRADGNCLPR